MGQLQAFEPKGKSFSITVGVASQVTPVNLADLGLTSLPQALQFENTGSADIWLVYGNANTIVAAFPTPGTTTTGTPQPGLRIRPGTIVVYSLNAASAQVPTAANPNVLGPGFYLATISGTAAQNLDVTPGEGV